VSARKRAQGFLRDRLRPSGPFTVDLITGQAVAAALAHPIVSTPTKKTGTLRGLESYAAEGTDSARVSFGGSAL
jgi:hypothetical protein